LNEENLCYVRITLSERYKKQKFVLWIQSVQ